ncbi:MAG: eukaryotic-like serine/threonine-protein kinase, partial [Acidobacteriota bacterium]|nr:eukaryotic-like serine/threonine-protein kinase [Acidobacteriota bacterium]
MIGQRLGPYEITAKLGEGGMGEVYRATDTRLDRQVAIKVLPAEFTADKERLARFEREAKLLAQVHHPNIASIFGLDESGGTRALVMELVDGPTLAERLESGAFSIAESLSAALQIAQALEEAHEKGIVHRDLKPQNIKASIEGKIKVLDFGLAKAMDPAAGGAASAADLARSPTLMQSPTLTAAHGTQLGVILGTAAYMAPEQARGGIVDKRADIWAFGVVLYEMLSGRRLFDGETVSDVLAAVLRAEVDFAALPPEATVELRNLLRRCLERNPKNRLHDIADARIVIEQILSGRSEAAAPLAEPPAPMTPMLPLWRRALPWIGGAVAGTAIAAALLPRGTPPVAGPSAAAAKIRTLVSAGVSLDPAVSPDGRTLAFESTRDGESRIWIKDLTSGSESVLVRRTSALPDVSPDGTSVLFMAASERGLEELYRVSLATREERLVARQVGQGTWAPDGRSVLLLRDFQEAPSGGGDLVAADLESGREQVLHRDPLKRMLEPRWSPDGKRVAVALSERQVGLNDGIGLLDVASGALDELSVELAGQPGSKVRGLRWISPRRLAIL